MKIDWTSVNALARNEPSNSTCDLCMQGHRVLFAVAAETDKGVRFLSGICKTCVRKRSKSKRKAFDDPARLAVQLESPRGDANGDAKTATPP
jgi:hypothetical protein